MNLPIAKSAWVSRTRQRGAAAVELAIIIPVLLIFLQLSLFPARYFWHYTVAQKAAQDAARYLSTISPAEMRVGKLAQAAAATASDIATRELADLNPGQGGAPKVVIQCGTDPCNGVGALPLPDTVRVHVTMDMFDDIFFTVDTQYGMPISADVVMRYVGI